MCHYGRYEVYDISGLLQEARRLSGAQPGVATLDAATTRYMDAYEAIAPVINPATAYYDRSGYKSDDAAEGQVLHKKMVPLARGEGREFDGGGYMVGQVVQVYFSTLNASGPL